MPKPTQLAKLDAQENLFFGRQLEQIEAKSYDVKYGELKAAKLVPVKSDIDPGANDYVFYTYDSVGAAKVIASYANDLPRVDISGVETKVRIKSVGAAFGYNVQEIRSATKAGLPLEQRKANAARRAIGEKLDTIAATGDAESGLIGIANQANASIYVVPNSLSSGKSTWADKTPDEILADMNGIANSIPNNTLDVEHGDTLLLPLKQYTLVNSTRVNPLNDKTILAVFLENNPYVKDVEPWTKLSGTGAGGSDRMICYDRDQDILAFLQPVAYEQFAPEMRGLEAIIACHARTGGVVLYYPLAMAYGDGI